MVKGRQTIILQYCMSMLIMTFLLQEDPTLLPQPNHVILNHLYALSIKVHMHGAVWIFVCANNYDCGYFNRIMSWFWQPLTDTRRNM